MKASFNRSMLATVVVIAGAAGAARIASRVEAFNPQPEPPGFGAVTLARGESMRATMVAFQEAGQKKKHHKTHVKFHTYGASPRGAGGIVALVDVTVIDGTGAVARPHQTLIIANGRIA